MNLTLIIVALIAAVPPTLAAVMSRRKTIESRKETKDDLQEIHVLVDGRLSDALAEIIELKTLLASNAVKSTRTTGTDE